MDKNQEWNVLCDYYNILTQNDVTLKTIKISTKIMCRYSFHEKEYFRTIVVFNKQKKKLKKK